MGTSNTRFLLGLLLGAILGGLLGRLISGSNGQTTLAGPSAGLSPEDADPVSSMGEVKSEGQLPTISRGASERRTARASEGTQADYSVADGEVQSLVAGLAVDDASRDLGEGAIWGKVVDQDGEPLAGVVFRISKNTARSYSYSSSSVGAEAPEHSTLEETVRSAAERFYASQANRFETSGNAQGDYRFEGLGDTKWRVLAYKEGYKLVADVSATRCAVGSEIHFTGTRVIEIPTLVFGPEGRPAEEAYVQAKLVGKRSSAARYTWSEEEAFLRLVPGHYKVTAFAGGSGSVKDAEFASEDLEIRIDADGEIPSLRLDLRGRPGIRGHVAVAKGDPAPEHLVVRLLALAPQQAVDLELLAKSDQRSFVRGGAEYSFQDLEPGRFVVGVSTGWSSPVIFHQVLEVGHGPVVFDIELPPFDMSKMLRVTAQDPDGNLVEGLGFHLTFKVNSNSNSSGIQPLMGDDGSYLISFDQKASGVYFGAEAQGAEFSLKASHETFGSKTVELTPGQTELHLSFVVPGTLSVTVAGYQGSGYEGRLAVQAKKADSKISNRFYTSSRDSGFNAKGEREITGLEPGTYNVILTVKANRKDGGWSPDTELESIEVEIHGGENQLQMQIPTLYDLRVHFEDGKPGANVHVRSRDAKDAYGGYNPATLDEDGFASWENLPAGDYVITGMSGQMEVTVPSRELEFEPMTVTAMRVSISDPDGDLAQLGFQHGDLIIGLDGQESEGAPDFSILSKLFSSKSAEAKFLVQRGSQQLEISVKGGDVGNWQDMGGAFTPSSK